MKEKYLPIGSVVLLSNATKRLVIAGFLAIDVNTNIKYDYCGFAYSEGFIDRNHVALFNHNQIDKIYHRGLIDDEEKNFKLLLSQENVEYESNTTPVDLVKQFEQNIALKPTQGLSLGQNKVPDLMRRDNF